RRAAGTEGGSGGSDHVKDLAKLAELKDKGAINAEEYEQAKAKLLA
ncbi:Short C-terminal domain-containing protein, partial [Streptomyces sp. Termitarium-T10T-6]